MEKYDLIVIGAGPSGYASAMRSLDFNKKTLLIEKNRLGGAGVTNGALSSKTWWEISRDARKLIGQLKNFNLQTPEMNYKEIKEDVRSAIQDKIDLWQEHMKKITEIRGDNLLKFKQGTARLLTQHEVEIDGPDGKETVYGENIILATGSSPRKLPEIPIDEKIILTSDGIENLDDFPESMVILGAGVIGCEWATIFSGFGKTKVNLIDKGDRILPFEDEDVVRIIERNMENNGVLIHRNSRLTKMSIKNGRVEYELEYDDGSTQVFNVEKALVSVGRVANYDNLWSDEVNIVINKRGIEDNETQTSVSNIYAVGDITADIALVNVAELEGRFAVEKIFGKTKRKLIYDNISTIMFLNPEVAGVGLNEIQAQQKSINYKVATVDYSTITRAIAKRNTQGFIKLLVTDDEEMKILGMRVIGNHASSAIMAVALLIFMDKGIEELSECVHPHPSIPEGIQECVRILLNKSLLKPDCFNAKVNMRRFRNSRYEDVESHHKINDL